MTEAATDVKRLEASIIDALTSGTAPTTLPLTLIV